MSDTPEQRYLQHIANNEYDHDPAQAEAVKHLQILFDQLATPSESRFSFFAKKTNPVKGIYLWGDVGRGKTWLMDNFYDCLPLKNKLRMHFHHFMKFVHDELHKLSGQKNPLEKLARIMAKRAKIICFDEFFVKDISDAMLMYGLLKNLFENGVTLVTTSNVTPDNLYKDGLQRVRFLPAIALLNKHTTVVHLDSNTDYRMKEQEQAETYFFPNDNSNKIKLQQAFNYNSKHSLHIIKNTPLTIAGRSMPCIARSHDTAWFSFQALCADPRSQNDYIELASLFKTVILEGLPQLSADHDDQTRRFISLIDEFYDQNVNIIICAETDLDNIYCGSQLAFEFKRTVSRLQEMQSKEYLNNKQ